MAEKETKHLYELIAHKLDKLSEEMKEHYAKKIEIQEMRHKVDRLERDIMEMKERAKTWRQLLQSNATWLICVFTGLIIFLAENGAFKHLK